MWVVRSNYLLCVTITVTVNCVAIRAKSFTIQLITTFYNVLESVTSSCISETFERCVMPDEALFTSAPRNSTQLNATQHHSGLILYNSLITWQISKSKLSTVLSTFVRSVRFTRLSNVSLFKFIIRYSVHLISLWQTELKNKLNQRSIITGRSPFWQSWNFNQ